MLFLLLAGRSGATARPESEALLHRLAELAPASTAEDRRGAVRRWELQPEAEAALSASAAVRDSALLRVLAQQVAGRPDSRELRAALAAQQVALVLRARGEVEALAATLVAAIERESSVAHRQLLDGSLDRERLELLIERLGRTPTDPAHLPLPLPPAAPVLTAAEILEQCRRHAPGGEGATETWQALMLEGRIAVAGEPERDVRLFQLRPDRWRLDLRDAGRTIRVVAWDGEAAWQQRSGEAPGRLAAAEGARWARLAYGETATPARAGTPAERLPDGTHEGRSTYRLAIGAAGPDQVVVAIDQERFTAVLATHAEGELTLGDFREAGGGLVPHRREWHGADGTAITLTFTRTMADPGLLAAFFQPPQAGEMDLFTYEAQRPRTSSLP